MIAAVVALNCLLAALVCRLALGVWRWRYALARLTYELQNHELAMNLAPKQVGYALAQQRMQIVETRLSLAVWQRRSRQIQQLIKLIRGLQTLLFLRSKQTNFRRAEE